MRVFEITGCWARLVALLMQVGKRSLQTLMWAMTMP